MKKDVGIITLYHNSNNYGGILQAYALQKIIEQKGLNSEIIDYDFDTSIIKDKRKIEGKNFRWIISRIARIPQKIYKKLVIEQYEKRRYLSIKKDILERNEKIKRFRDSIKHSNVYSFQNINQIANEYKYFISGSDQIWKPGVVDDCFTFNFIQDTKEKVFASYASSISVDKINHYYIEYMKKSLEKYDYISVREENTKRLLEDGIEKKVEIVLDPTLLIENDIWDKMCQEPLINEEYIFCYLLGENKMHRKQIKKFAQRNHLKIAAINHIGNLKYNYKKCDEDFADYDCTNVGIEEFLGLIKCAKYVLTDSFHACIFSYLFKKDFYVLSRDRKDSLNSTNSRIYSLLECMNLKERYINLIPENMEKICYETLKNKVEELKIFSKQYIDLIF